MYFQFAYTGSLDMTVLNNATKHASVVTMSTVRVFLGANKAGRGTCVVKVFFFYEMRFDIDKEHTFKCAPPFAFFFDSFVWVFLGFFFS